MPSRLLHAVVACRLLNVAFVILKGYVEYVSEAYVYEGSNMTAAKLAIIIVLQQHTIHIGDEDAECL